MTRRFARLAWLAATCTYLLIILGAIVRITGSGLGCGEHWPLCNGRLLPPLDLPTLIEYGHRLAAAAVSILAGARAAGARGLGGPPPPLALAFVTVLFGALTANLGAASACLGFPLCNGAFIPAGNYLQHVQWTHRLLAFALAGYVVWWALRTKRLGAWYVVGLVALQVAVAAAMILLGLPRLLRATHVAVGAAVWAGLVLAVW